MSPAGPRNRSAVPGGRRLLRMGWVALVVTALAGCDRLGSESPGELAWNEGEGFRWAELQVPETGRVGFEALSSRRTGVDFRNTITDDQAAENRNLLNGSGVAVGDVTGNGFPDLYFARLDGPNVLYENLGGYRFRDITEEAGVALPGQFSSGVVFADLNGSGHLDLVVTSKTTQNRIFFNDGSGRFQERVGGLPALRNHGSSSIAIADLTGNGAPDLYIANYKPRSARDIFPRQANETFILEHVDGEPRITETFRDHYAIEWIGDQVNWYEVGEGDLLYRNDGAGNFEPVPLDSGILLDEAGEPITGELRDWGLHVRIQDITGNGLPDIYLANDFNTPDRTWINNGDGTFRAIDPLAIRKIPFSSMAVDFGDLNRDGTLDFLAVEMISRRHMDRIRQAETRLVAPHPVGVIENRPMYAGNTLYANRGDGTWAEIGEFAGVRRSGWSWSTFFVDVNLNGYEDILVANGHFADLQDFDTNMRVREVVGAGEVDISRAILVADPLTQRNVAFRNEGDFRFEEVGEAWGFTEEDISHGMALVDLNNTGTRDLVINRLGSEAAVMRNLADGPRVAVRLRDRAPNTEAIGAKIRFQGGPVPQSREVIGGGAYLSNSQPQYTFATAGLDGPFSIEIDWRDGTRSRLDGVHANRIYEIDGNTIERWTPEPLLEPDDAPSPLFEDTTGDLTHSHFDPAFPWEERQPLIPLRLSQEGPGVSLLDWTGTGDPDLLVGSGRGGALGYFENRGGSLVSGNLPGVDPESPLDQTAVVGFEGAGGVRHLLVGLSSWEGEMGEDSRILHYIRDGSGTRLVDELRLPGMALGPLALADYTGNGAPDLFAGGRAVPGRYPEAAPSYLFRQEEGRFVLDPARSDELAAFGLVTGALFTDLNGSGTPELVVATEWGPVRVLSFEGEQVVERTADFGLGDHHGWWRGVASGDLTGNGLPDLVVTNRGLNFWNRNVAGQTHRLYYGDYNRNGFLDLLEAYHDEEVGGWVLRRPPVEVGHSMPFIPQRFGSVAAYAAGTVEEALGPYYRDTRFVEGSTMSHMVFLNEGGHFRAEPLPAEAQFSPGFGVVIADFDGDGHHDVAMAQNFFHWDPDTPRSDAGRGLLLRGDGTGALEAVPGQSSGIRVYGEQRGLAAADLDGNGRLDLVLAQNGARTRLFRNRNGTPGLGVRLVGSATNPSAIGAGVRLVFDDGTRGPLGEVQAGGGYWSQQPATVHLTPGDRTPESIEIRWPDGSTSVEPFPVGERQVVITQR